VHNSHYAAITVHNKQEKGNHFVDPEHATAKMQSVALLWAQHKHTGAFKSIVAQEFERALTDLSAEVMQNEAEVCNPDQQPWISFAYNALQSCYAQACMVSGCGLEGWDHFAQLLVLQ